MDRDLGKIQEALDELTRVEESINELEYYRKYLRSPNHSEGLCDSTYNLITKLNTEHANLVNALMIYGSGYRGTDSAIAASNNPNYNSNGSETSFTYISAPEHEKGFWEKTYNQIVYGDFSDDATWLGTVANIALSFTGIDFILDLRDTAGSVSKGDWLGTGLNVLSLLPVVGVLGEIGKGAKHVDNIVDAGGTIIKHSDDLIDAGGTIIKHSDDFIDAGGTIIKHSDDVVDAGATIAKQGDVPQKMVDNYYEFLLEQSDCPNTIVRNTDSWKKISVDENELLRVEFNKQKSSLIMEWEKINGTKWPTYDADVFTESGKKLRSAGSLYDAHHIQPLSLGGKNVASNITPLHASTHFDWKGVHAPTSPYGQINSFLNK